MDHDPLLDTRSSSPRRWDNVRAPSIDAADLGGIVRRQSPVIIATVISLLVLATLFVLFRSPTYIAATGVLIETRKAEIFLNQSGSNMPDPANVDSQSEILKSDQITAILIGMLGLAEDPDFVSNSLSDVAVRWITSFFRSKSGWDEQQGLKRTIEKVKKVIVVRRVGVTNLLAVEARSADPVKAAALSNGLVEAYLQNQLNIKRTQANKASEWLEERTGQLEAQLRDAEQNLNE